MFNGKIHYFDWAMFNSKLLVITRGFRVPVDSLWEAKRSLKPAGGLANGFIEKKTYGFVWKCWVNIPNEIAI